MSLSPLLRLFALFVFVSLTAPLGATEVNWRQDYDLARQEARQTGRPLLVDIGTEACYWCKRLDVTTFRDDAIAQTLNDKFIPVKLDGERYPKVVKALGIDSYPTLVFAASGGHILDVHAGYLDAAAMKQKLAGIAAGLGAARTANALSTRPTPRPAQPAPTAGPTVDFKPIKYDELTARVRQQRGKVVVVGIWDTNGQECLQHLTQLHERFGNSGVVCLSVNVDAVARRAELIHLLSGKRAHAHVQLDEERALWQERWSVSAAPAVYVFRPDGRLACRLTHKDGLSLPRLEQQVRELVASAR